MEQIILINGNVSFPITLDPTVWILDDRKVDLLTCFTSPTETMEDNYVKEMASFWNKELETNDSNQPIRKVEKEKLTTASYGMPLHHFLHRAEPKDNATTLHIITATETHSLSLEEAKEVILGFSKDGKALRGDGPVHIHMHNRPVITHVRTLTII
ncbi:peptidyl-prolyl cis-trans isomerase [Priestia taiwanensis]|uniref:Uncharacterized protein n=1 Tax=Priestia taiwanensis TaxID=1347902 RepID=A0A917EPE4_9BACI|nr:peptidyl-prolyl cis-trans isomerase [Priestia taiwanensis]MBM7362980.1 hypothetical protein [Priestia taiwanensis]GGE66664.1 hypothetical protein GCM10007140_16040 [Priestia taiwanensis]